MLKRAAWYARRAGAMLSWMHALGLALLIAAAAVQLTVVSGVRDDIGLLRSQAETLQRRSKLALRPPSLAERGPAGQLDTFYEFFPAVATLPQWVLSIYRAAENAGLSLDAGDYTLVQEKGRRLARYQIALPVRGSYQQIREFMASVLNDVPAAAFEDIGLQRESSGSAQLDAKLRLTLFVRMENW